MRRFLWVLLVAVLAVSLVACGGGEEIGEGALTPEGEGALPPEGGEGLDVPGMGEGEVAITAQGVEPAELTATAGEPVVFVNEDEQPHALTIMYLGVPLVEEEMLDPGEQFERAFQEPGEYEVIVDGNVEMAAMITVG